jgi:hypothetical protein
MERFWNIVHYFVYRGNYKLHLWFNYINPIRLILLIPVVRRFYAKKGIDIIEEGEKAFKRPDIGISSIWAGGFMYVLVFLICFGVVNYFSGIMRLDFTLKLFHFIILLSIPFVINYFLLFKQDKYLTYFKEFEIMRKEEKKRWAWISFVVIIAILLFFIGSFVFMSYRL